MAENRERDSQKMRHVARAGRKVNENTPLLQEDTTSTDSSIQFRNATAKLDWSRCRTACVRRSAPKGKGLLLLLFVYAMESLAFYSATKGIRELLFKDETKEVWGSFLYSLIYNSLGRLFYPLAGILADSYFGRYNMIQVGLWLVSGSLALVCLSLSVLDSIQASEVTWIGKYALPILCIIPLALGSASVEVNVVSFGVDQLPQGCSSDQISSFFYWFNFIRNISTALGVGAFIALFSFHSVLPIRQDIFNNASSLEPTLKSADYHYKTLMITMMAVCGVVAALIFHVVKHHWYFKNREHEHPTCIKMCRVLECRNPKSEHRHYVGTPDNPVKTVCAVSWSSLTIKRGPLVGKARYGGPKLPRIELTKEDNGGDFKAEAVENVKTFYQILFIILSLGGYFASYNAAFSMLSSQFADIWTKRFEQPYHFVASNLNDLINAMTIAIFLPIFNHGFLPFLSNFNMSLKIRLSVGLMLNLLAIAVATFLEGTVESDHTKVSSYSIIESKLFWLLLPAVLLSLGETLTFVTSLEFIYAQAPESMKGLLTGIFYFMFGICGGVSSVVFYIVNSPFWFYIGTLVVAFVGLLLYALVACLYRNRRRPDINEDDYENRLIIERVYSHTYTDN